DAPSCTTLATAASSGGAICSRYAISIGHSGRWRRTASRIASKGRAHSGSRDPWAKRTIPFTRAPRRSQASLLSSRAEAARAALAFLERLDHVELHLQDGNDHELRDPFERLDLERFLAAVPARDHELALVVGIDEPHEVAEHDAVLVAKSR